MFYSGDVSVFMYNRLYKLCKTMGKKKETDSAKVMTNIMLFTWVRGGERKTATPQ